MKKYNIPTASFATFTSFELAKEYLDKHGVPIVVKYDGLAQGKGVVVAKTYVEAIDALKDMLIDDKFGQAKVVLEDYLEGPEFSFMCFVDGVNVYPLELAQDHKRSFDFDKGLNTGGMGAYSPLKFITKDDIDYSLNKIMKPVAKALVEENRSFTGVLYGGLMKTVEGIKVIEFNARFGDPETEVVLPRLTSDLCQNFLDVIDHKNVNLKWSDEVCIGIVMASKGYPQAYIKGAHIGNLDKVSGKVYYMGVCKKDNQIYTNGGRVLIVVEKGSDLLSARNKALEDCKKIECSNLFYRTDIGHWSI
jgi:phosphoribosylamine--glycine ligase